MKYGRGLVRSTPDKVAHRLGAHEHPGIAAALAVGPGGGRLLTPCQRTDQGRSSTCHAHSAAAAFWTAQNAAGVSTFVPSPLLIASATYADVRAAAGLSLAKLQDTGAQLQDDANAMAKWGVAPIQAPTADGRFSDVPDDPTATSFPEPDLARLEAGALKLVGGEYAIPVTSGADAVVAASIDAGVPVWLGTLVDSAFERLGANDVAQPANEGDPQSGGHALYISGYRTHGTSVLEFRVENSWGSYWADGGAVWASTAWLLACWDLWPFSVAAKGAA